MLHTQQTCRHADVAWCVWCWNFEYRTIIGQWIVSGFFGVLNAIVNCSCIYNDCLPPNNGWNCIKTIESIGHLTNTLKISNFTQCKPKDFVLNTIHSTSTFLRRLLNLPHWITWCWMHFSIMSVRIDNRLQNQTNANLKLKNNEKKWSKPIWWQKHINFSIPSNQFESYKFLLLY